MQPVNASDAQTMVKRLGIFLVWGVIIVGVWALMRKYLAQRIDNSGDWFPRLPRFGPRSINF
jgi:hypothetical protein